MKKKKDRETEMYLCGEEYEKEYVASPDYFFDTVLKFLGIRKLREAHSGDVSQYLYWLLLGTVFVMVMFVVLWA